MVAILPSIPSAPTAGRATPSRERATRGTTREGGEHWGLVREMLDEEFVSTDKLAITACLPLKNINFLPDPM